MKYILKVFWRQIVSAGSCGNAAWKAGEASLLLTYRAAMGRIQSRRRSLVTQPGETNAKAQRATRQWESNLGSKARDVVGRARTHDPELCVLGCMIYIVSLRNGNTNKLGNQRLLVHLNTEERVILAAV